MARTIAKDHEAKREAILKTAAVFFAKQGFDRASMVKLADACGVSKALIYHYYPSKDALLFDILDTHLTALVEVVEDNRGAANRLGAASCAGPRNPDRLPGFRRRAQGSARCAVLAAGGQADTSAGAAAPAGGLHVGLRARD
jgi:AcrR family transcriptional regulator